MNLKPLPENLSQWIKDKKSKGEVAHFTLPEENSYAVFDGNPEDPIWIGLPFAGMDMDVRSLGKIPLFKVGIDPPTSCGIYLRADVYDSEGVPAIELSIKRATQEEFESMTKDNLIKICRINEIYIAGDAKKSDLVAALVNAQLSRSKISAAAIGMEVSNA